MKKDAPSDSADIVIFLAYASQFPSRQFSTATIQRRKNVEAERKLTLLCSHDTETESMKHFRLALLRLDIKLIRCELDHRALWVCAQVSDKQLKCEQLKQLRSMLAVIIILSEFVPFTYTICVILFAKAFVSI